MANRCFFALLLFVAPSLFSSFPFGESWGGAFAQTWLWAKSATGTGETYAVCSDASGNVFLTGYFRNATITFGSVTLNNSGVRNAFIAKYDAAGNMLWAKSAGGTVSDWGSSVSADASGNVFVTGYFQSSSIQFGSTTLTNADPSGKMADVFIVKYDANGIVLWAKNAGGAKNDEGHSISTDAAGNAIITGEFLGTAISFGSITLSNTDLSGNSQDGFIAKYDANGTALWASNTGGAIINRQDHTVSTDANGNVFLTGRFQSPTITFGSTTLTNADPSGTTSDVFISKYDANGNVLWAQRAGGSKDEWGYSVSADISGNVFATGTFQSPTILVGSTTLSNAGVNTNDIFIAKYDAGGNALWAQRAGGTKDEWCYSLSTDGGNVYATGYFQSASIMFGSIKPGFCS